MSCDTLMLVCRWFYCVLCCLHVDVHKSSILKDANPQAYAMTFEILNFYFINV